ncbi:MAG: HAMP domain-containing protein [Phycisphaerales bacterium]|nr:HAMP domain-containing protein [Phycisphaerales bacterium]
MLRRKLLIRIGLLIGAFVSGAVVAILLLQLVVQNVDRVDRDTAMLTDSVYELTGAMTALEAERLAGQRPSGADVSEITRSIERLASHPIGSAPGAPATDAIVRIRSLLPAVLEEGDLTPEARVETVRDAAPRLRAELRELGNVVSAYVSQERSTFARTFRLLVLGLTLAAIVMVNASVIVLLHTVHMILRPVDRLVGASRELAREHFGHRVDIDQDDEFGELAHAYNRLAEQLEANEERKMETLRQVAVALNHDLNNTLAAIELELRLADLQSGSNPRLAERFARMHQSVARVAKAVRSLAQVRRIVLTEYMPGQMMLDLERSVTGEEAVEATSP